MQSMRRRDAAAREFLDEPDLDANALARNLGDIRRINWLLGWTSYTVRGVAAAVRARHAPSFSLLDLASGSADMPLAIARWSRDNGIQAHIVATDISPEIVAAARRQAGVEPMIQVEQQNALDLPYAEGAFDIALCTLALHHFDPEGALRLLKTMARVGTTVLVYDVVRSPLAYSGAVLLTRGL
jgi:ubiquinone/menaquinone biosynthesis C-methylase UbiE